MSSVFWLYTLGAVAWFALTSFLPPWLPSRFCCFSPSILLFLFLSNKNVFNFFANVLNALIFWSLIVPGELQHALLFAATEPLLTVTFDMLKLDVFEKFEKDEDDREDVGDMFRLDASTVSNAQTAFFSSSISFCLKLKSKSGIEDWCPLTETLTFVWALIVNVLNASFIFKRAFSSGMIADDYGHNKILTNYPNFPSFWKFLRYLLLIRIAGKFLTDYRTIFLRYKNIRFDVVAAIVRLCVFGGVNKASSWK